MTDHHYTLPAEWEPQAGVQLTWPHEDTDWKPYLKEITQTFIEIAQAVAQREPLLIAARDTEAVRLLLKERLTEEEIANVHLFACNNNDTWARDHAFITLTAKGAPAHLTDFCFNGWGNKFAADKDNALNRKLYDAGAFKGTYVDENNFVLEGGSIESDGRGTILTSSQCLLAPHRNQPLTREEIEERLKASLGANHVLWVDHGNLVGDDTDGHIDTIVRMAPNDTLLYIAPTLPHDEQYANFKALEDQLRTLRTAEGKPYRLLPLPMNDAIVYDDERLPATYANFLVINGAVIVPTYGQAENDEEAKRIIASAFPEHDIIGIDANIIIRQHGSIHCLTMQYPEGSMAF